MTRTSGPQLTDGQAARLKIRAEEADPKPSKTGARAETQARDDSRGRIRAAVMHRVPFDPAGKVSPATDPVDVRAGGQETAGALRAGNAWLHGKGQARLADAPGAQRLMEFFGLDPQARTSPDARGHEALNEREAHLAGLRDKLTAMLQGHPATFTPAEHRIAHDELYLYPERLEKASARELFDSRQSIVDLVTEVTALIFQVREKRDRESKTSV